MPWRGAPTAGARAGAEAYRSPVSGLAQLAVAEWQLSSLFGVSRISPPRRIAMTTSARWDGQWLKIIEDLLAGDKDARATMWRRVFQHIEHLVRLDIGPLSDDKEVRRDIAVRVLGKLEANEHRNLRAWVDRQRRGTDSCSWWGFINVVARRCAIDHARTSSRNIARRGEPFRWVRVEPEDPSSRGAARRTCTAASSGSRHLAA
jgi:hypothetical protein